MNIRAVLFDLDGVLLKSMEQHLEAWQHAFRRYNALVKESGFYQLEGRGVKAGMKVLAIPTTLTKDYLQEADFIADGFGEIKEYLKKNILS